MVSVVGEGDRGAGKATAKGSNGKLTWRFKAENVRDVTWATSNLYLWDATTASVGDLKGDGVPDTTMIYSFYRPDQRRNGWGESAPYAARSISIFSRVLWPYPYPHMTVVDGPSSCGGMEYPMMTCIGGDWNARTLFDVEAHEIAHMWFPMQVGSDEKRYAWMDEGMAQYFQSVAIDAQFPDADDVGENRRNYLGMARYGKETEMMRNGDKYPDYNAYGIASYFKPATVLVALGGVIGDSTLMQGIREYGKRWTDRHPMPNDFWNTMNQVSGVDLDWFWRTWYYETWKLDQAIDGVVRTSPDTMAVTIENKGRAPMPVLLVARGAGGTTTSLVVPVDVWLHGREEGHRPDGGAERLHPGGNRPVAALPRHRPEQPDVAQVNAAGRRIASPSLPPLAHRHDSLRPWRSRDRGAGLAAAAAIPGHRLRAARRPRRLRRAPRRRASPDAVAAPAAPRVAAHRANPAYSLGTPSGRVPWTTHRLLPCWSRTRSLVASCCSPSGRCSASPVPPDIRRCSGAPIHPGSPRA